MTEVWRPVPGYEGRYAVSDLGRVRSTTTRPTIMKLSEDRNGYPRVRLWLDSKTARHWLVHRLVLLAFVGPPPSNAPYGLHGPGGLKDCRLSNLYYGTAERNNGPDKLRDGTISGSVGSEVPSSKLTEADIPVIRTRYAAGETQQAVADDYGVSQSVISGIVTRKWWKHVG